MPNMNQLVTQYLQESRVMQIATTQNGKPWICTVYYVEDANQNLYWLSLPSRRHSQEIIRYPAVAVAIAVKLDQPVIGIQAEGDAERVTDSQVVSEIMQLYVERYKIGKKFYDNFMAGKNQHHLYKFTPRKITLFDEVNFAKNNVQVWTKGGKT